MEGGVTIIEKWFQTSRFEVDESGRGGRRSPPLADNFVAATKRLRVKVKEKREGREREEIVEGINRGVSSEEGGEER